MSGAQSVVEIMGFQGLDYVVLDTEHSDGVGITETAPLIRAADAAGIPSLVRIDCSNPDNVLHVLDYGAIGVQAPHIRTRQDAEAVVRAVKYHPEGQRGMCPQVRAAGYGGWRDWAEYWPIANEETMVIAVIEDPEGMENIEAIAQVPGIDVIWVGIGDLGQAMGIGGELDHPLLIDAQRRGKEAADKAGKPCMSALSSVGLDQAMPVALSKGYTMFMLSTETSLLTEGIRSLRASADRSIQNRAEAPSSPPRPPCNQRIIA
jgi:2-keto-3-deoxy-L-rhamnonate aldolase RhmA